MRTAPQAVDAPAAAAADVARRAVAEVARQGKGPVSHEARVAQITGRSEREEKVKHHAHAQQAGAVGRYVRPVHAAAQVVGRGQSRDDHQPHRRDEHRQHRRQAEGIERRVIVELLPRLGDEVLHTPVERGRPRDRQTKQCGIETVDVVEVNGAQVAPTDALDQKKQEGRGRHEQRHAHTAAAERMDELRDGVGGYGVVRQPAFRNPAHCALIARHFDPQAVRAVLGHEGYVRHDHLVAPSDRARVRCPRQPALARPSQAQAQRVARHLEVIVQSVVVLAHEGGRVEASPRRPPAVRGRSVVVVAGRQCQQPHEQQGQPAHRSRGPQSCRECPDKCSPRFSCRSDRIFCRSDRNFYRSTCFSYRSTCFSCRRTGCSRVAVQRFIRAHGLSSDNVGNQNSGGSGARRAGEGQGVRAKAPGVPDGRDRRPGRSAGSSGTSSARRPQAARARRRGPPR